MISDSLTHIDVEQAKAWSPKDEIVIKKKIEQTIGFSAVNGVVKAFLAQWLAGTFQQILDSNRAPFVSRSLSPCFKGHRGHPPQKQKFTNFKIF